LQKLVIEIDPDMIVCSGWIDKDYLKITKQYFGKISTVMSLDTHWKGSAKQLLATVVSRFTLMQTFSHAWVPGEIQKKYALRLGFKEGRISKGFYSCDLPKFNGVYERHIVQRTSALPRRFLYVGRYYEFKGISDLWMAFEQFKKETKSEWELWCLGAGDIKGPEMEGLKHFGFVQPSNLEPIIEQCSVFILPSRYEPWAVVVQEYAASGFPLLLSKAVGAAEAFLDEGKNGFLFESGNIEQVKSGLKKMSQLSDKELISMSHISHQKAQQISPSIWVETLLNMYHERKEK
jgi:glycosyltransferase involved in cell wall biosynthesis